MPNNPEPTPKVFISYAWKNQPIAKQLQRDLQRDGVEVFVDYEKISGGDSLPDRISAALDWCNTLILLWSADAAASYYVKQEWTSAFHLQRRLIACVLDGTTLPALLRGRLYLNFIPYEAGYAQLCHSLGVQPKPAAEKTAPPEVTTSKLPPQHVEMPVPPPPEEKREPPPPKRKPVTETLRSKPKPSEPPPVLKPPAIIDDPKIDAKKAVAIKKRPLWTRRKFLTATLVLIVVAAVALTWKLACQEPAKPTSQAAKSEIASPKRFRDTPTTLSYEEVKTMLQKNDFYCGEYDWSKEFSNPQGRGFANKFEKSADGKVIFDRASGLTWQQAGSDNDMTYADAEKYVRDLNARNFAGHSDWRLPTLEEAMSLMEREENSAGLYIDPIFDKTQTWIWTTDKYSAGGAWVVSFQYGYCRHEHDTNYSHVRVVR
ncbi:MAG: hypothetical protein ILNGONEN_00560 [Syntrophorhabdaceae bacterium]|nr:hypothetical protein [Syntrophorhabdaceae bacterium]